MVRGHRPRLQLFGRASRITFDRAYSESNIPANAGEQAAGVFEHANQHLDLPGSSKTRMDRKKENAFFSSCEHLLHNHCAHQPYCRTDVGTFDADPSQVSIGETNSSGAIGDFSTYLADDA